MKSNIIVGFVSDSEFENIQKSNRELWLTTLRREHYFLEINKLFKEKL